MNEGKEKEFHTMKMLDIDTLSCSCGWIKYLGWTLSDSPKKAAAEHRRTVINEKLNLFFSLS